MRNKVGFKKIGLFVLTVLLIHTNVSSVGAVGNKQIPTNEASFGFENNGNKIATITGYSEDWVTLKNDDIVASSTGMSGSAHLHISRDNTDNHEVSHSVQLTANTFEGGNGTPENPYIIRTAEQLNAVRNNLHAHFKLENHIDLSIYDGHGWEPIGSIGNSFTGNFDGFGFSIKGLTIKDESGNLSQAALFGQTGSTSVIRNVSLQDVEIFGNGKNDIGSLVGTNYGTIESSSVEGGIIEGEGSSNVGSLVGTNYGTIESSSVEGGIIEGEDLSNAGSLVGTNYGTIESSSVEGGIIEGEDSSNIGSLVGTNNGTIESSSVEGGIIEGEDLSNIGGLVGQNVAVDRQVEIVNSYANIDIKDNKLSFQNNQSVGGLVGQNIVSESGVIEIKDSYATGNVSGSNNIGGLIGYNKVHEDSENGNITISNSYATGEVSGDSYIGGLVGSNDGGLLTNTYATGDIEGKSFIGGLVGENIGDVSNSYSLGAVTGDDMSVGGLVGANSSGVVSHSYWNRSVNSNLDIVNGVGKPKKEWELKQKATFESWDFNDTWYLYENETTPFFRHKIQ